MSENDRKIIVTITPAGAASVAMIGGHLTKRELDRVLKAIKQKRNRKIREYNQEKIVAAAKETAEAQVEKGKEDG